MLNHDRKLGLRFVAGADEAGRGCLAGPLVTAAVCFDYRSLTGPDAAPLGHLDDSKKLPLATRERLYDVILARATSVSVIVVASSTIDRVGLHKSNLRGLGRALTALRGNQRPEICLVDGFDIPGHPDPVRRMIKGDATSAAIAAASVIAKVTRDRLMRRLDVELDERWAFADHVGYATPLHHERIRIHGLSDHHRRTFASAAYEFAGAGPSEGIADVLDPFDPSVAVAMHEEDVEPVDHRATV